jgi:dUTP pyrophosphatase
LSESQEVEVLVTRLEPHAKLPVRAQPGDAGFDLCSVQDVEIAPMSRAVIPVGLAIALPPGYVGLVHPRSGLAKKHGLTLTNSPGTIDSGYRGPIEVLAINHDPKEGVAILQGERIAQLLIQRLPEVRWHEVSELPGTHRGQGGFGSTGVASR